MEKPKTLSPVLFDVPVDPHMGILLHKETKPTGMRALSWKQPYASLMLHGKIETRTWRTQYRGPMLICASQSQYKEWALINMNGEVGCQAILNYLNANGIKEPLGKAIAVGNLIDCRPMEPSDSAIIGKTFVRYRPGLWCHIYENVQPIQPFDWKGSQGWRTLTEEQRAKIKYL